MSEKEPNIEEDMLQALMDAWSENPNLRFGQLLMNVISPKEPCSAIFSIEDSKLIKLLNDFKANK